MIFKYSLSQNDCFQYMLYFQSKDENLKKFNSKRLFGDFLLYGMVVFAFVKHQLYGFLAIFSIIIVYDVLFFRTRQKKFFFNHFSALSKQQDSLIQDKGVVVKFNFEEEIIEITDFSRTVKTNFQALQSIIELDKYYFINFISDSFIIPKAKVENVKSLEDKLIEIAQNQKIEIKKELHWKW